MNVSYTEEKILVEIEGVKGLHKITRDQAQRYKRYGLKINEREQSEIKETIYNQETKNNEQGEQSDEYKWAIREGIIREGLGSGG